jgi:aspartate racemase
MPDLDELECRLTRIWESVLDKRGIGVDDNFWELGGQSLTALRLVRRIEKQFGRTLPINTLLHVPTIEDMAKLLQQSGHSPAWSSLVALQPSGYKPPFFCVHALGGLVVGFRHLACHLGPSQPVYGLQAQGMEGRSPILTRVEEMAAHYIREIRTVQPKGPYYLGGLCFGGWVAYEMAQQLNAESEQVGLLALFDSYAENSSRGSLILKLLGLPPRKSLKFLRKRVGLRPGEVKANIQRRLLPRSVKQVRKALRAASNAYVPRPYPGRITFFKPTQKSVLSSDDTRAAWEELAAGGLDIQEVPGDHENLFTEPQVVVLAGRLNTCLENARIEHSELVGLHQPA